MPLLSARAASSAKKRSKTLPNRTTETTSNLRVQRLPKEDTEITRSAASRLPYLTVDQIFSFFWCFLEQPACRSRCNLLPKPLFPKPAPAAENNVLRVKINISSTPIIL